MITGKKSMKGNHVSHANNKTTRRFRVNLMKKKFFVNDEVGFVTLKVSKHGLRIIDKIGIEEAMKRAAAKGYIK